MRYLIRIITILSVLDIIGLGAIWFVYSTILAKQGTEIQLRKEIADEKQKGMEFTAVRKTVTQAEKESGVLRKYFYEPGEESQIKFVAQMEALGISTSHALVEMSSLDITGGGMPGFHGELTVKGTWSETYHFLRLLETFPAHIIINRFNVTASDKNASTAFWTGAASIDLVGLKD